MPGPSAGPPQAGPDPLGGSSAVPGGRGVRRIGLYGGSFDPVHNAHVALARLARDHLGLDELRLLPAGQPWQKAGRLMASPAQRAAMVALAVAGEPRMKVETFEVEQAGPNYTVDTLQALQARPDGVGEWFLVLGEDQYDKLHTWHDWPRLAGLATLAVAARDGRVPRAGPEIAAVPHRMVELPLPAMPVSSRDLRQRLRRGEGIAQLVPPAVARYIAQNHLYRS